MLYFVLPICYQFWYARKYTFVQHLPGKQVFAPLAQLAEQVTLNHWVAGSIPARCISCTPDSASSKANNIHGSGRKISRFRLTARENKGTHRVPLNPFYEGTVELRRRLGLRRRASRWT